MSATTDLQNAVTTLGKSVNDLITFVQAQTAAGNVSAADAEAVVAQVQADIAAINTVLPAPAQIPPAA